MPWESAAPLIIITGAVWAMSEVLGASHKLAYGRPKATGLDPWDRGLAERDQRFAAAWDEWLKDQRDRNRPSSFALATAGSGPGGGARAAGMGRAAPAGA